MLNSPYDYPTKSSGFLPSELSELELCVGPRPVDFQNEPLGSISWVKWPHLLKCPSELFVGEVAACNELQLHRMFYGRYIDRSWYIELYIELLFTYISISYIYYSPWLISTIFFYPQNPALFRNQPSTNVQPPRSSTTIRSCRRSRRRIYVRSAAADMKTIYLQDPLESGAPCGHGFTGDLAKFWPMKMVEHIHLYSWFTMIYSFYRYL